jgi:hypothetical protein
MTLEEKELVRQEIERQKTENILKLLNSKEELRDWLYVYFDIKFPMGVVYPGSTHGPIDAMWRIYELIKTGESGEIPEVVMLSSRDSGKTLCAAALEVLCMIHFRISVGHMAAIQSQSLKAISYINGFLRKIKPYLEYYGWAQASDSKSIIGWLTDDGQEVYIKVVIATISGANSEHLPLLCVDEIDVISDPRALEEAKMIPSTFKQYKPLTVYLSTRKFAGGLMEKTLKSVSQSGGEIFRWNMVDITRRITKEEAKTSEPKVTRYISRELPLSNISPEEFEALNESQKDSYMKFEAYAGIANHPLLPVMKNTLVDRPQSDFGGLFKDPRDVYNNFKKLSIEMANAQLLCEKPSTVGLVYPRFDAIDNAISVADAYEQISGTKNEAMTFDMLIRFMIDLGVEFYGGGDWGFTDATSLVVLAVLPNGEVWLMDNVIETGLELEDIVKYAKQLQEQYPIIRWYCDSAYPAYLKTLNKNGIKAPTIEKDVAAGISALQRKIVDVNGRRTFKVIDLPRNKSVIEAFGTYKWKLDGKGDPTDKPEHGNDGTADIMDSIRYPMQILFSTKNKFTFKIANEKEKTGTAQEYNNNLMSNKINELAVNNSPEINKSSKRKIVW